MQDDPGLIWFSVVWARRVSFGVLDGLAVEKRVHGRLLTAPGEGVLVVGFGVFALFAVIVGGNARPMG